MLKWHYKGKALAQNKCIVGLRCTVGTFRFLLRCQLKMHRRSPWPECQDLISYEFV